jgi:hypothetical protein
MLSALSNGAGETPHIRFDHAERPAKRSLPNHPNALAAKEAEA